MPTEVYCTRETEREQQKESAYTDSICSACNSMSVCLPACLTVCLNTCKYVCIHVCKSKIKLELYVYRPYVYKAYMCTSAVQTVPSEALEVFNPTNSLHCSSFLGLPFRMLNIKLVKPNTRNYNGDYR